MQRLSHQIYSFDEFVLDVTRGCLLRGQNEIKLRPKSFEVLKYLVENYERLISKNELIRAVWIDATVTDDSLVQCLKDIRHALCDEAQQLIKNVHGRGYIFDTEVRYSGSSQTTLMEETAGVQIIIEDLDTNGDRSLQAGAKRVGPLIAANHDLQTHAGAARPIIRLMVLPFRMLRTDPDIDFLAFSVPDAVAGALSLLDSVVVRSPTGAARYSSEILDLKRIAEEARAEAVLTGTILRAGNGIRVTCELMEAPSGTVLWWDEPHVNMSDLFELQDNLVRRIVESLSLSLSAREHGRLKRDVPTTSAGYECYLRGNELSRRGLAGFSELMVARDLYRRSVETDPRYAPAWAQLGRCYRLIGKGMENGHENLILSESAFQQALALNPDLPVAHSQYAFLEAELGRAKDAVARLLRCAQTGSASPDLFVALVLCCRFCGLLEPSVAAHERARKLDPQIATSVSHTYYQLRDYDRALSNIAVGAWAIEGMTLGTIGRKADVLAAFRKVEQSGMPIPMRAFVTAWRAMFEQDRQESLDAAERCIQQYLDPEGVFYMGLIMAHLGESERALTVLSESMDRGFSSVHVLRRNPWFDGLRSTAQFNDLLKRAEARLVEADDVCRSAGGPRALGIGLERRYPKRRTRQ
ncbi:MAG TPA: winged helix-turn-helix domain-containing protein [Pyrinomonadaceae bacterium]|nr:winged helix-turn-helix domain-containing protein [Pyrinomonadaceae bacterium]